MPPKDELIRSSCARQTINKRLRVGPNTARCFTDVSRIHGNANRRTRCAVPLEFCPAAILLNQSDLGLLTPKHTNAQGNILTYPAIFTAAAVHSMCRAAAVGRAPAANGTVPQPMNFWPTTGAIFRSTDRGTHGPSPRAASNLTGARDIKKKHAQREVKMFHLEPKDSTVLLLWRPPLGTSCSVMAPSY